MRSKRETDRGFRRAEEKLEAWREKAEPKAAREGAQEKPRGPEGIDQWEGRKRERLGEPNRARRKPEGGLQAERAPSWETDQCQKAV